MSEKVDEAGWHVTIGSTVTLTLPEGLGEAVKFTLVDGREADPSKGWISSEAPLARAVVGHQVGDEVTVPVGRRYRTYRIASATG